MYEPRKIFVKRKGIFARAENIYCLLYTSVTLSPAESYREVSFTTAAGRQIVLRQEGIASCDILLEPDLSAYTATSVFDTDKIFDVGYACAKERLPEIVRLLRANKMCIRDRCRARTARVRGNTPPRARR